MKGWKEEKMGLLISLYGACAGKYQDEHADGDRAVFVQTYNMLMAAMRSLPNNPHVVVRVAMNRYLAEDMAMLDGVKKRYPLEEKHHEKQPFDAD